MDVESMKKGKALIEKCIEELFKKNDLTPAETKAALDGMQLRELLRCEIEDCQKKEEMGEGYSETGYSGYRSVPRHYTMTAYGYGPMHSASEMLYSGYPGQPRNGMGQFASYGNDGAPGTGNDGWAAMNGRSMSAGAPYYGDDPRGYSRHSIGDRAVEKLENLMDSARSEYEREELKKFIRSIRQQAD